MSEYYVSQREFKLHDAFYAEDALDAPCINTNDCFHHHYEIKTLRSYVHMMRSSSYDKQLDILKRLCFFVKSSDEFFKAHPDARTTLVESLTELSLNQQASSVRRLLLELVS